MNSKTANGGGLDHPLAAIKMDGGASSATFAPRYNWRGLAEEPVCATGQSCGTQYFGASSVSAYYEQVPTPNGPPAWSGSLIEGSRDASGLLYKRNRYYDPASGRFTSQDPLGLGGGLNVYGFAGNDPFNQDDPFGLCPPEDHDPCNMSTGDPNLDNPKTRNIMEDGFKNAGTDAGGYALEAGGVCYKDGQCTAGTNASREGVALHANAKRPISFDWHTHGNVGRTRESGIPGDMYTAGFSSTDSATNKQVYQSPLLKLFGNASYPSYVVDKDHIYRMTPDSNGNPVVVTFNRWSNP